MLLMGIRALSCRFAAPFTRKYHVPIHWIPRMEYIAFCHFVVYSGFFLLSIYMSSDTFLSAFIKSFSSRDINCICTISRNCRYLSSLSTWLRIRMELRLSRFASTTSSLILAKSRIFNPFFALAGFASHQSFAVHLNNATLSKSASSA